ncbi:MAG TPA: BamA/TamA family outer membrane protein [Casimicrobiaceae bacterium]|nr:BamA/TamA family outer membrane protein [Casimicrobiaceae bacterium]
MPAYVAIVIALFLWVTDAALAAPLRYQLQVDAPEPLKGSLSRNLDLVRWENYEAMTPELLDRLVVEAREQARQIIATEGYFEPKLDIEIDEKQEPAVVKLSVEPGLPTRVTRVELALQGPVADDPIQREQRLAPLVADWSLPEGAIFRQADWTAAKERMLKTFAANDYAAATIASSKATIDPDARSAVLEVTLASGPAFRFGETQVTGLELYRPEVVLNLNTIKPGEPYAQAELVQLQRRLSATGYFASVQTGIDTDPAKAAAAPVTIAVIEAPTRRLEVGVGYSTDTTYNLTFRYSDVNLNGNALQFVSNVLIAGNTQTGSVRFNLPPRAEGYLDSLSANIDRSDIQNLVIHSAAAGVRRRTIDERDVHTYEVSVHYADQEPLGADSSAAHALYLEYRRTLRRVDDVLSPTTGYMANLALGGGIPGASSSGFGRAIAQFVYFHPLGTSNSLELRAEGGAVFVDNPFNVPADLMFRTGGDTTVRGYAYLSLGVKDGQAVVGGKYYTVATAEFIHWVNATWGLAAFVDAGNASNSLQTLDPAAGYGIGARIRTPIGPLRFDVAYGERTGGVRVHMSVGVTF